MSRFTTRMFAVLAMSFALFAMLALPVVAAPGGNAEAKAACENGGYVNYTDVGGNAFKNEGQCIKYAAQGNTPVPVVTSYITIEVQNSPGNLNIQYRGLLPGATLYACFDGVCDSN